MGTDTRAPGVLRRYWASFYFPGEGDHRSLTYPPNLAILGWWCSGWSCKFDQDEQDDATLCIWVEAESEDAARAAIVQEWPEAAGAEWRFFNEREPDWHPNDRFPLADWSKERVQ